MTATDSIMADLPYLRRYARALSGSQAHGDAFVSATLEAILAEPALVKAGGQWRVGLYHAFHRIWESAHLEVDPDVQAPDFIGDELEAAAQRRLAQVTPLTRQALLLTSLEGFTAEQAASIMALDPPMVNDLIDEAMNDMAEESSTQILIIEDEPLIALQLEQLVMELGHTVCGIAATQQQAAALVSQSMPNLVLADIQLGDGSSGIDAVKDILAQAQVPVIFITAFPEHLLTGERPEPTYLIVKPFKEDMVRTAISQAMYLGRPNLSQSRAA